MRFMRQVCIALLLCGAAFAAELPTPANNALPAEFAGWQTKGDITRSTDPADVDATNAPVLKEYGFHHSEKASYTRDDGRNLTIKAAVFDDASGAYGAFTYYDSPDMEAEKIGGQAAFQNNRVLFYQGNVLVDAMFDRMSVMSAAQLRCWRACCHRRRATGVTFRRFRVICRSVISEEEFRRTHQVHSWAPSRKSHGSPLPAR